MTNTMNGNASPDPVQLSKLRQLYESAGQGHVFTFYDTLSTYDQVSLLDQLANIDVQRVNRIYHNAVSASTPPVETKSLDSRLGVTNLIGRSRTPSPSPDEVTPLPDEACVTILNNAEAEQRWKEVGLKAVADNTVAVLLLAGGQGTRLGSSAPKGMYDLQLPSGSSLFEYQAGRIRKLERIAEQAASKPEGSVNIKWYVMTSGPTRAVTEKYFEEKGYFGLKKQNVVFFEQGVLPALSDDGKLLLSTPSSVSVAPDGNGGLYAALRRPYSRNSPRTVMSDLKEHGIKYIHGYCVDNCLVKVADPVFLGACIERNAPLGSKVVRKTDPAESVGVLAMRGEKFGVVEYSEISKEKSEMRTADGQLAFRAANIVNHFYTTAFLDGVEAMEKKMAFHIAKKKIPTVDLSTGEAISPSSPNGMKLELFVFDVFPFTSDLCVLEVGRAEEFSPLKNAPGSKTDSPETSRRDLLAQQKRWLEAAGAEVAWGVEIEVVPQATYGGEGLDYVKGVKFAKSGVLAGPDDITKLVK